MSLEKILKNTFLGAAAAATILTGIAFRAQEPKPLTPARQTVESTQDPGQYVPYVDGDTQLFAFNPTDATMTVTASYGLIGTDPRNGAQVQVTIPPHATVPITNALPSDPNTHEGSAYIQASGSDEPVLTASTEHTDGSGMDIPILPYSAKNNLQPQAGILANGMQWEKEIVLSGDSTSNNTLNHQAYGPDGTGPTNASPAYLPSGIVTVGKVGTIFNGGLPAGSTDILIPQASDQSKAGGLLLYTNPTSGDTRLRPMQNFTAIQQYDISVWIQVVDHGQGYEQTTTPSAEIVKKIWQVNNLDALAGTTTYVCTTPCPGVVCSLDQIAENYNTMLTPAEQQEFSGDAMGFAPFVNDSNNDGSVCDPTETDQDYLNMIRLTITPR